MKAIGKYFVVFILIVIFIAFLRFILDLKSLLNVPSKTESALLNGIPHVALVVGVLSKLTARNRRDSVRLTWFQSCRRHSTVVCRFFTDTIEDIALEEKRRYVNESNTHNDLIFMPYKGGHNFALRLVWMIQWYMKKFHFDYFLRIDDDYFLCLDRLLFELPQRKNHALYWGYIHCTEHVIRVDEGWMILSRDIIKEALSKFNTTLQCHPFGDQAVALWVQDSKLNITYFSDNSRVIHAATAYQSENFLNTNICKKYLALHGSYPTLMMKYWIISQEFNPKQTVYEVPDIIPFHQVCKFKIEIDWRWFWPHVRFEPRPCKDNPKWDITDQAFIGREDKGEEAIY